VKKAPGTFDLISTTWTSISTRMHCTRTAEAAARGLFITDNTLWSGKAARPAPPDDVNTQGVQEFNRLVYASKKTLSLLIPLRDGVTVCQKL